MMLERNIFEHNNIVFKVTGAAETLDYYVEQDTMNLDHIFQQLEDLTQAVNMEVNETSLKQKRSM